MQQGPPNCSRWTDDCVNCSRGAAGAPICSNIGFACQPKRSAASARNATNKPMRRPGGTRDLFQSPCDNVIKFLPRRAFPHCRNTIRPDRLQRGKYHDRNTHRVAAARAQRAAHRHRASVLQHGIGKILDFPVVPASPSPVSLIGRRRHARTGRRRADGARPVLAAGGIHPVRRNGVRLFHRPRAARRSFRCSTAANLAILFCFIFLYLVFAGPGPWSVDAKMKRS